jgi:hypothetical protein
VFNGLHVITSSVAFLNFTPFQGGRQSLADKFEYIMHGKLYKILDETQAKTSDGGSGSGVKVYVYTLL